MGREQEHALTWEERILWECKQAAAERDRLREALAFYADPDSYIAHNPDGSHIWLDGGKRARSALSPESNPEGQ